MIRTSKAPVAWPVPWNASQQLFFRPGDVIERGEMESDLAADYGAGRVFSFQLSEAFAAGVAALLGDQPEDAARLTEWERAAASGNEIAPDEAAAVEAARQQLSESWPAYRVLVKKVERRRSMSPIAAFRRYCTGWEGDGLPDFARGPDGFVTLDAMRNVDPLVIEVGGMYAYSLQYGSDESGNSERPSKSGDGRSGSNSGTSKGVGSSPGASGRKTRSSSSPRGRSKSSTSGSTAGG